LSQHNKDKIFGWLMTTNQATLSGQVEVFANKELTSMVCASSVTIALHRGMIGMPFRMWRRTKGPSPPP
jgi:hypothetical protein